MKNIVAETTMMTKEWRFFEVSYLKPGEIGSKVLSFAAFLYATHVPAVCDLAIELDGYEIQANQVRAIREERPCGWLSYFLDGQVCFTLPSTSPQGGDKSDDGKLIVKVTSPPCESLEEANLAAQATIAAIRYNGTVERGRGLQKRLATIAADLVAQHGRHLPEGSEVIVPYWTAKGRGGQAPVKAMRRFATQELN